MQAKPQPKYTQSNLSDETKIELLLVGNSAIGKSSIISRFVDDEFIFAHNPTVGI